MGARLRLCACVVSSSEGGLVCVERFACLTACCVPPLAMVAGADAVDLARPRLKHPRGAAGPEDFRAVTVGPLCFGLSPFVALELGCFAFAFEAVMAAVAVATMAQGMLLFGSARVR